MRGLEVETAVHAAFARRLNLESEAPLAVAVSGGGDSVALLAATAEATARPLIVLTIDHGLQAESAGWCVGVAALATRFGATAHVLRWEGPKPTTGLPAAARAARHALLAEAARAAGASVLLLGHTADDGDEGELMRAAGTPLGRLREWAPSPAWPEGRGVFVLRPLLACRRSDLREWLFARGLPWVDDPANVDGRSARAKARIVLSSSFPLNGGRWREAPDEGGVAAGDATLRCDGRCTIGARRPLRVRHPHPTPLRWATFPHEGGRDGSITVAKDAFRDGAGRRLLAAALACASGKSGRLRTERVDALLARLGGREPFSAVLGGARVQAGPESVAFAREGGRGGLATVGLELSRAVVWDGRFELLTEAVGLSVTALAGHAARLPEAERRALKAVPALARPTLPLVVGQGVLTSPVLAPGPVTARCLVYERLSAALGGVIREA